MNFYQFINIIWSRKGVALWALIVTVLTTLVVSLLLPKQYLATTSIVAEQRSIDPVTGMNLPVQLLPGYMATQVEMIGSHHVARKVVDKLKLNENPGLREDFIKAKVNGDIRDWIAEMLLKELDIRPS
ncbi:MAG: Wzz/FepE/Etk N-terminal domain-containing protein, partial [Methylobacter sp.]|nr:Wzz/FepE/Etk N-terminal domain-containing protein [Methylobacter sp.]